MNIHDFDEDCSKEKKYPIYKKRYKTNGEEYLKKVDEIDIEEQMKENKIQIERLQELVNTQERLKEEELLDDLTNEEFLQNLNNIKEYHDEFDTYDFLNKTEELKEIYNKMPEEIRKQYNNISKFGREYLPKLIKNTEEKLNNKNIENKEEIKQDTNEEIQKQIEELQKKLDNGGENNV